MSRQSLWTIVTFLAVVGSAVWFFSNFERVPDKEWTGYQGEARRNSFLAAERLLDRMGVRVRLLEWVAGGGHLIVENESHRLPDPILDALGVKRVQVKTPGQSRPTEVRLPHAPGPLKVSLAFGQTLAAPEGALRVQERQVTQLVHVRLSRGQATV